MKVKLRYIERLIFYWVVFASLMFLATTIFSLSLHGELRPTILWTGQLLALYLTYTQMRKRLANKLDEPVNE